MKKTLWLALVLLLVCVFVFSACDNGDSPSNDTTENNQQTTEDNNSTDPIVCEHTFGDWNTVKQATCKDEGAQVRVCNKCSEEEKATIAKTNTHTEVVDAAVSASCEKTGLTEGRHCSQCNKVIVAQTTVDALGHKDENKDHICDNNCGKNNIGTHADSNTDNDHVCDYGCGAVLENCFDTENDQNHACDVCGKSNISGCHYTNATCGTIATCSECGVTTGTVLEHIDENKDHICDRECGKDDMGEHKDSAHNHVCDYGCAEKIGAHSDSTTDNDHVCDYGCGEIIEACYDTLGDNNHSCDACGKLDVTTHTYSNPTCDTPATCTECAATTGNSLGHSFTNYVSDNNATYESDGTKTAKCNNVGCNAKDTIKDIGSMLIKSEISFATLSVNGMSAHGVVSNATEVFSFGNEISTTGNADYIVALDEFGIQTSLTKNVPLTVGDNTFYVFQTVDGKTQNTYVITIRRRPIYQVTFDTQGGTTVATQSVEEGGYATIPSTNPTKDGYNFASWNFDFTTPITNSQTIESTWNLITYSVEFDLQGGILNTGSVPDKYNIESIEVLPCPAKEYYEFDGWYDGETRITSLNGCYGNITLVARWKSIFNVSDGVITGLTNFGKENYSSLIIPEQIDGTTIIGIGYSAFSYNDTITSITLPETITSIGEKAFYSCDELVEVNIPKNVTQIGRTAFYGCYKISEITIPENVTSIGKQAFAYCYGLTTLHYNAVSCDDLDKSLYPFMCVGQQSDGVVLTIGKDVEYLPNFLFNYSYTSEKPNIITLVLEKGCNIESIGSYWYCPDVSAVYVDSLTDWFNCNIRVFSEHDMYVNNSKLTSITLTSTMPLYEYAFAYCSSLTEVVLDTVTSLPNGLFNNCSNITELYIPNTVTFIGYDVFDDCNALHKVVFEGDVENLSYSAFTNSPVKELTIPVKYISYFEKSLFTDLVLIGDDIISYGTLKGCSNLVSLSLNVASLDDSNFGRIFGDSFTNSTKITQYYVNSSGKVISTTYYIPSSLKTLKLHGETIPKYMFSGLTTIDNLYISNSFKDIDSSAFYKSNGFKMYEGPYHAGYSIAYGGSTLETVILTEGTGFSSVFPESVTTLVLPDELTIIYANILTCYPNLRYNEYEGGKYIGTKSNPFAVLVDGSNTVAIHSDCRFLGMYCFQNSSIESLTIPNDVFFIGEGAFSNCENLKSIVLPDSVSAVGTKAFENCKSLSAIKLSENITVINSYTFDSCESLTNITIPNKVTKIDIAAFRYCTGLITMDLGTGVKTIGNSAFAGCASLKNISISDAIEEMGTSVFYGCDNLIMNTYDNAYYLGNQNKPYIVLISSIDTEIGCCTIHSDTKVIYADAFSGCSNLMSIIIPDNTITIGNNAFYNCANMMFVTVGSNVRNIGDNAFYKCNWLVEVFDKSQMDIINSGYSNSHGYIKNYALNLYTPTQGCKRTWETEDNFIFYEGENVCYLLRYLGTATQLTLPESCNGKKYKIYGSAFANCLDVTEIIMSNNITEIGGSAFQGCSNLKNITMSESLTYIGDSAFRNCTSLTSIVIPSNTTRIMLYAFYGCSNLSRIYFENTSGWRYAANLSASGVEVSRSNIADSSYMAKQLTGYAYDRYWWRNLY